MRIKCKWFITGNVTSLEEQDSIIGPQTTMLEIKGLLQIRYGYPAKDILILQGKLLENDVRLRDIGITSSEIAAQNPLTVHVIANSGLEDANAIEDDTDIQEFTHEDFALAMRMIGKQVPVTSDRLEEMRKNPPRMRPAFLNVEAAQAKAANSQPPTMKSNKDDPNYDAKKTKIHKIFQNYDYGMRTEGAESKYAIDMPGVRETYQYWDLRLPENETYQEKFAKEFEVCFELFFFGDFKPLSDEAQGGRFNALVRQMLQTLHGFKVRTPVAPREAGCMYPLIAVAVVMTETEGMELGNAVFEDFGKPQDLGISAFTSEKGNGPAKPTGGCGQQ